MLGRDIPPSSDRHSFTGGTVESSEIGFWTFSFLDVWNGGGLDSGFWIGLDYLDISVSGCMDLGGLEYSGQELLE